MFLPDWVESFHSLQQHGVRLEEVWPGQHHGRPELAAGDVEQAARGAVAFRAEAAVAGVFLGSSKHIGRRHKSGHIYQLLAHITK